MRGKSVGDSSFIQPMGHEASQEKQRRGREQICRVSCRQDRQPCSAKCSSPILDVMSGQNKAVGREGWDPRNSTLLSLVVVDDGDRAPRGTINSEMGPSHDARCNGGGGYRVWVGMRYIRLHSVQQVHSWLPLLPSTCYCIWYSSEVLINILISTSHKSLHVRSWQWANGAIITKYYLAFLVSFLVQQ